MREAVLLSLALLASLIGMGWLALAMEVHWTQVRPEAPFRSAARRLRFLGALGLGVALALCLAADHASMAALVWVMAMAGAALAVAFTLAWRPGWLRALAWVAR